MYTKRCQISHALLVKISYDAASISTTKHVGRNVARMSEGAISDFPSGAPLDHPGHFRVLLHMILLVHPVAVWYDQCILTFLICLEAFIGMICLLFAGVARHLGI